MKKKLIRTGIAAVAVLSLLAGWYFTLRPGVYVGDAYFFLDRWRYRVPELSEAGIWMERLNGIIICVIGVLAMSGVILLFFN